MKKQPAFLALLILLSVCLFSCSQNEKPAAGESTKPAFDLATAKKEIEAVNKTFMDFLAKGDSAGIASLYTTDAKLMFGGAPAVVGRAGIQSVFGGFIRSGIDKADLIAEAVYGTEELLVEEEKVIIYVKDKVVGEEKGIVLWKKENGKWRLFRDITNSNGPK